MAMTAVGTIAEIRRYPVKSMQGEHLERVNLTGLGIAGDRTYALRDLATGKILSAKVPKVGRALLSCAARTDHRGVVVVTVDATQFEAGEPALDRVLGEMVDRHVRVERATGSDEVYESYWPEIEGMALSDATTDLPVAMSTAKGTFVDLAALHLLSVNSVNHLASLNAELELSIDRFRPGIVIAVGDDGGLLDDGFVERHWVNRSAHIGSATIALGSQSPRCIMTTLTQGDLAGQPAVLQTLATHNRLDFAGFGNFACLGIYGEIAAEGDIALGDTFSLVD
jgi:uncharacterized protein